MVASILRSAGTQTDHLLIALMSGNSTGTRAMKIIGHNHNGLISANILLLQDRLRILQVLLGASALIFYANRVFELRIGHMNIMLHDFSFALSFPEISSSGHNHQRIWILFCI